MLKLNVRTGTVLLAAIAAVQTFCSPCSAGVTTRPNFYKRLQLSLEKDYSRGMDASMIHPVTSMRVTTSEDVAKIIPAESLQNVTNSNQVATKIIGRSLRSVMASDQVKQSGFGRTAAQVGQSVETDMGFGGREPNSIEHKIKFAMKPSETRALMTYSGVTNAQVSYEALDSRVGVEIREPVAMMDTDLVYNHINRPGNQTDVLSLAWSW